MGKRRSAVVIEGQKEILETAQTNIKAAHNMDELTKIIMNICQDPDKLFEDEQGFINKLHQCITPPIDDATLAYNEIVYG